MVVGATVASRGTINCTSRVVPLQGIDLEAIADDDSRYLDYLGRLGRLGRGIQLSKLYKDEGAQ